jgi:hypothetical protein
MRIRATTVAITLALSVGTAAAPSIRPAAADPAPSTQAAGAAELSETTRLGDRRAVTMGDRFYSVSTEDGLYPAAGFHTRGEMGGFWTPPLKLLDGIWFALDGAWLGKQVAAQRFTAGYGHTGIDYAAANGVHVERTDVAPDGARAGLIGLTFSADSSKTVRLDVDAHSELMSAYPWGGTTPNQLAYNLPDSGGFENGALVFHDQGTPDVPNAAAHDFTALVAADRMPVAHELGAGHRGPQEPPVVCPTDGDQPNKCDDTAFGKGTGGRLSYDVKVPANRDVTVWIAVAGSDQSGAAARSALGNALSDPAGALARKTADRRAVAGNTIVDLPGDRLLQQGVEWSKQNLADSVQEAHGLRLRSTNAGNAFPAPQGTLDKARWIAAGLPDYPWLFGTDGEYTAFAAVAAGQFDSIEAHLRALRDASDIVNDRSGKVIHEMVSDGSVFFGANADAGNTDETAKFPSVVALVWRWTGDRSFLGEMYDFSVRNMRHVVTDLDADGDGWPEGLGNVERNGMGVEKLDNTVYTIRGLWDLADMAKAKHDTATERWATDHATAMEKAFDQAWWFGGDTNQFADSLDNPGDAGNDNTKIFQRHWIGLTPMEAEIFHPGQVTHPLATDEHARAALARREEPCYTGPTGLFHTGTGPTSADGGNKGAACDTSVSSVQSERSVFSLGNGVMAVAEGNYGRLVQQQQYTDRNARLQLDPAIWEMPGAMPEIAPSPDFNANIDQRETERSSALQAWGTYGILWPVVNQQLGVSPDLGNGHLEVVPQVPPGQARVAGHDVRLGGGAVDVTAEAGQRTLRTVVSVRGTGADLLIGQVLPAGAGVASVTLDGKPVATTMRQTARGSEVVADAGSHGGTFTLIVTLR